MSEVEELHKALRWRSWARLGCRTQIVEGSAIIAPERPNHSRTIRDLAAQLGVGPRRKSGVRAFRIALPEQEHVFLPDVVRYRAGATSPWSHQDIEFVAEVVSKATTYMDYGPKLTAYATLKIPLYLVVDPSTARCHLYSAPEGGDYARRLTAAFGEVIRPSDNPLGLTLKTDKFPRD
ncbi:Uma2 family endonuclease [Streptomyces aurantiacus]|uniref:Uma2 family endonuclease n=1 Tax=Streptomyces aurantiacus TaxID=47760 RepID=UPI0007C6CA82|nr:Uma2 family endonuclease [Streptomyces aurantiacus]